MVVGSAGQFVVVPWRKRQSEKSHTAALARENWLDTFGECFGLIGVGGLWKN